MYLLHNSTNLNSIHCKFTGRWLNILVHDSNDLFLPYLLLFGLSSFLLNTFVFGAKRASSGYVRQFLRMDTRGQSDQVRIVT